MKARILLAIALTLLTIGGAYGVQRALFPTANVSGALLSEARLPQNAAKSNQAAAVVAEVFGQVQRKDASGHWIDLRVGEHLDVNSVVRTSVGASARLAVGESVVMDVAEETEFAVAEVSARLSRVRLDDGRIGSIVKNTAGFKLRVEVKESDVKAETSEGEFFVMKRGAGGVSVMSKSGITSVSSKGEEVAVRAGEQTFVEPGQAPAVPMKIPSSLLLKLGRVPPQVRTRETTVQGSTSPGAVVSLNGERTTADAAGHFEHRVPLNEGPNVIQVEVEDTAGRKAAEKLPKIDVDSQPPNVTGKVKW